jgi:hypothetical protein
MELSYHSYTFIQVKSNNRALTPACVGLTMGNDLILALSMCGLLQLKRAGKEG